MDYHFRMPEKVESNAIAMLERKILYLFAVLTLPLSSLFSFAHASGKSKKYLKVDDGVIIYPDANQPGSASLVKLQVISDNIIRVLASPFDHLAERKSLITVYPAQSSAKWDIKEDETKLVLKTKKLTAVATLSTGAVVFLDSAGNKILGEKETGGRNFQAAVFDGSPSYHISQSFDVSNNEALYGLGQHQDDIYNYRGRQVTLFQNNTEVAIPFLISNKNYGILWDNYSLTKVGDTRSFGPLSTLRLFSKNGEQGWLTASYYNDKSNLAKPDFEKAESSIDYEYLNATKLHLPSDFKVAKGEISWEGSISSEFSGMHQFRFTYAGYVKVWVDGKLLMDRWRQAWNPGSALLDINLDKEKKYSIKIDWIPDGSESYLSAKWLSPLSDADKNNFSFSSESGKMLDYYFIYGNNMDEIISGYRMLTGKSPIPPKWAMGFWQSRERYKTQNEILNTISEFREKKIPIDNIVLDWSYWKQDDWGSQEFDAARFSNPDSMIDVLHKKYNAHFMISVWPKFYEGVTAYKTFNDKGWLYKRNVADGQRDWIAKGYISTFYDAFNTDAQKGFWDLLNIKLYKKGIDAWWMDASEPDILSNVNPEKRKEQMTPTALGSAAEFLNAYPLENAKGIYEGQRSTNPDQRVFILTRSAFAGSQRYGAAIWSGDIASRWSDMKAQISAGINFSLSGLPYWTMDIGGFSVEHRYESATGKDLDEWREQMTRWYQFGAFCPLFRVHGQYPYREIFNTAPENHPAYQSMLYYDKLRYKLMPYIYSLAEMTYHKNYTIMRGLVMDFANDSNVNAINDQYLFGPSLLINPVYDYQSKKRELYLPAGQGWYDLYSGKYFEGGQKMIGDAPYERMPVFVKEGSIIPFGPELQYVSEKPADPITLFVYTGKDASFDLYEDENTNYNYEKGMFTSIHLRYDESEKKLIIAKREGSFPGMLKNRSFKIVWIKKNKEQNLDIDASPGTIIKYNGEEKIIKLK
ncbi:MAG TPA: TIM-barrel domain-containing protein [Puia sp.]|nr:TIM-barrel domain-containing protein [Puia sp.]